MTGPRLLGARYELGDPLGHGGMAEVLRGRDVRLGREVAVKVLRPDLARDPSFQTRFRREAQASAALNHPSIVAVYDTGEDLDGPNGATPFIVMEFIDGRTLREILSDEGRLMPERAMEVTADICAALDFSHRNGIVHRDVKPGNVMITRTGTVKVMDFGIARALTDSAATVTATAQVIGTAQYLSPEQARGENVDARSDVYSTGCLLYELLTGTPPFTGDSPVALAYQHVRENPAPPSSINPDVSPAADAIVLKAMAKNPANRYQSAGEMRSDLLRAVSGRPVLAEPVLSDDDRTTVLGDTEGETAAAEAARRRRRTTGWVLLGLLLLGLIVAGALLIPRLLGDSADQVTVPSLTSLTRSQAQDRLKSDGLKLGKVSPLASDPTQKGKVLTQSVSPGSKVKRGSAVNVQIGSGPATTTVPPLKGLSLSAARKALANAHLKVGGPISQASTQAAGTVLDSQPPQGQHVAPQSTVTLIVSSGKVTVPSVLGKTDAQAHQILATKGFTNVTSVTRVGTGTPGTVIDQNPGGGTVASPGSAITLVIDRAAPSPSPSPSPNPSPSSPPSPSTNPSPSQSAPPTSAPPSQSAPPSASASPSQGAGGGGGQGGGGG